MEGDSPERAHGSKKRDGTEQETAAWATWEDRGRWNPSPDPTVLVNLFGDERSLSPLMDSNYSEDDEAPRLQRPVEDGGQPMGQCPAMGVMADWIPAQHKAGKRQRVEPVSAWCDGMHEVDDERESAWGNKDTGEGELVGDQDDICMQEPSRRCVIACTCGTAGCGTVRINVDTEATSTGCFHIKDACLSWGSAMGDKFFGADIAVCLMDESTIGKNKDTIMWTMQLIEQEFHAESGAERDVDSLVPIKYPTNAKLDQQGSCVREDSLMPFWRAFVENLVVEESITGYVRVL
jgi:hypothetical protein